MHISKTETRKKGTLEFLHVMWESPNGRGFVDANCFDVQLWPHLVKPKSQHETIVYTIRKGNYLNIVGVRA